MTKISELLQPPQPHDTAENLYKWRNAVHEILTGMTSLSNVSQMQNSNFSVLGSAGMTPTTQADGDNAEFMDNWFVVGATEAAYTLSPTVYSNNSGVICGSSYFVHVDVSAYSGSGLYFYQRQMDSLRKYQSNYITLTLDATNNQNKTIKLRFDVYRYFNPSNDLISGGAILLNPGKNTISTTLAIPTIRNQTIGSGSYTEFRLYFADLIDGTADFDLHLIKCEFGKLSTPFTG
jgi:hypothetical protein